MEFKQACALWLQFQIQGSECLVMDLGSCGARGFFGGEHGYILGGFLAEPYGNGQVQPYCYILSPKSSALMAYP